MDNVANGIFTNHQSSYLIRTTEAQRTQRWRERRLLDVRFYLATLS